MDEFVLILFAGLILIGILAVVWTSETKLTVTPDSKYLTIAPGSSVSFFLTLNGTAKNVTLRATGEISNWVTFDRTSLDVLDIEQVRVTVSVPTTATYGFHNGDILIESYAYQSRISLVVNVTRYTVEKDTRYIHLGDFTISYLIGSETVKEKEDLRIERGYFSEKSASFAAIIPEEKLPMVASAYIKLLIDETNGLGNLIIELNGNETFNQKVGVGEIVIPLSKEKIMKSNSITLRSSPPGWVFWSTSFYTIASAKFVVEYNGTNFKETNFNLDNLDVMNFKSGEISFFVKNYDVNKLNDLTIKINGETVFDGIPKLTYFRKTFGHEVPLNTGVNTISFSVDPDTFYELEDVTLAINRYP